MGLKAPLIPFGISGPTTQGGYRTPLGFFQGGGVAVVSGDAAVPHSTLGLFCDTNNEIAVQHSTLGLFCDVVAVDVPVGGVPSARRKQKDYNKAYELELDRRRLILTREIKAVTETRPTIRLRKSGIHKERILELSNIQGIDQSIAIEFEARELVRKAQDDLAIEMLLRNDTNFVMPTRPLTDEEIALLLLML